MVGFGFIAEGGHLPAYRSRHGFDIVAVADTCAARRDAARRALPAARIYENHEKMLVEEASRLEFIDITTPPYAHAPIARAALAAGLHVICEKPFATTVADARAMIGAARRANRVIFPAHNYKHAPVVQAVRRVLATGAIGPVHQVTMHTFRATHARGVSEWNEGWRLDKHYAGGGIAMDHGSHTLYLAFEWMRGMPLAISATASSVGSDAEDTLSATLTFRTGVANVHLTWRAGMRRVLYTLHGSRGAIRVEDDAVQVTTMDAPEKPAKTAWSTREEHVASHWMDARHAEWFAATFDRFDAAMAGRAPMHEDAEEALRCVEVIEAVYASAAAQGSTVTLETTRAQEVA
jgi:predicted dehydrogenase